MSDWEPIHPAALVVGDAVSIRRNYCSCEDTPYPATTIVLAGRVVDAGKIFVTVEWCTIQGEALYPPKLHHDDRLPRRELERCNLRQMPSKSPKNRYDVDGRTMMMDALRKACGRDPEKLGECVDPETRVRVGSKRAETLLQGSSAIREWMIRQCDGRLPIPEPVEPDFDIDVRAIMRAVPGAVVKEVRLRPPVEDEDEDVTDASPSPDAELPVADRCI